MPDRPPHRPKLPLLILPWTLVAAVILLPGLLGPGIEARRFHDPREMRSAIARRLFENSSRKARQHFSNMAAERGRGPERGAAGPSSARPEPARDPLRIPKQPTGRKVALLAGTPLANVRANNPFADPPGVLQSEASLAALGPHRVLSWNDGLGFEIIPAAIQGVGVSSDGGASWTDLGEPPGDPAWSSFHWAGDPVVTVNEKTASFYVFGLAAFDRDEPFPSPTDSAGIAMARGHFEGGTFVWDDVKVVRAEDRQVHKLDKEWAVADSSSGKLYVIYVDFLNPGNQRGIKFTRSGNDGVNWSTPITLSSGAEGPHVHSPRVAVGPGGEVYTTWVHDDSVSARHEVRFRASYDGGVSFGPIQIAATFCANAETGAPGFNRYWSPVVPSLSVDRTHGQHRGRIYVAYSASYDFTDDQFVYQPPANTVVIESETNDDPSQADPFSVGHALRGSVYAEGEDWFRFTLPAGRNVVFWVDSLAANLEVFSPDAVERLTRGAGMFVFTSAAAGEYFLKVSLGGGAYRIRTKYAGHGGGPGRDRRDPFVVWSQGGSGGFSAPSLVTDAPPGSDDYFPEVAVGPEGRPYVLWFDHRDDPQGGRSHIYLSRSNDGGDTWLPNVRLTDSDGSFTQCAANAFPNMGDYIGLAAGADGLAAAWGDARGVDVDLWTQGFGSGAALGPCPADPTAPAGTSLPLAVDLANASPFFADQFEYAISDDAGWVTPASGFLNLAAGQVQPLGLTVQVPAGAAPGERSRVCVTASTLNGGDLRTCCFMVTSTATVAVGGDPATLWLGEPAPNPVRRNATIGFSSPSGGAITLTIFDVGGARVRTLAQGWRPAGRSAVTWDGRDEHGLPVAAGVYFLRLEAGGRQLHRRLVVAR